MIQGTDESLGAWEERRSNMSAHDRGPRVDVSSNVCQMETVTDDTYTLTCETLRKFSKIKIHLRIVINVTLQRTGALQLLKAIQS